MASPSPDSELARLSQAVAAVISGVAALSVLLILTGLVMGWMSRSFAAESRVLLISGGATMVASPLAGVARLAFAFRVHRRLAWSAVGTLVVVGVGAMLAR